MLIEQLNNNDKPINKNKSNVRMENQMAMIPFLPTFNMNKVNQSIRIDKSSLHHSRIAEILKKRKCMQKQKIIYNFPSSRTNPTGKPVQAHIIKWDPEYTKTGAYTKLDYKNRPAFWKIRTKLSIRTVGKTMRVDLRPELYGKMTRNDGWVFEDEDKTMKKCYKSRK